MTKNPTATCRKASSLFSSPDYSTRVKPTSSQFSVLALVISIFLFGGFLYNEDFMSLAEFPFNSRNTAQPSPSSILAGGPEEESVEKGRKNRGPKNIKERRIESTATSTLVSAQRKVAAAVPKSCDLFSGKWVYDGATRPVYREDECEFLTAQVTCMRNGRTNDMYQRWRWQPRECTLPTFDAKLMLERLRGRRLMFVGDSLNRNQWESMICLVQSAVPPGRKSLRREIGNLSIFRADDYNATVEFYWAPFLVESNSDDPKMHSILNRIIMADSISKHAANWKHVDYLIFNTYAWWMSTSKMKVLRGTFGEGSEEFDEIERPAAYERVLTTWASWVDRNVNRKRTSVFFVTPSPLHLKSMDWNNPDGVKCAKETEPILNTSTPVDVGTDRRLLTVAAKVTGSMRTPVRLLNITMLSEYRKEAHTSVHTIRQGKMMTPEQVAHPEKYADCIHWCLPGLPDVWNEFLYAWIMSKPL